MNLPEALEQTTGNTENRLTAIYIAILAVLIAICSIGDDEASKTAMRAGIDAADTYAFFQAKNIRQTNYELAADQFELTLKNPSLDEGSRQFLQSKIDDYRATAARYESEPDKGEGKKELLVKARDMEAERDLALKRDPYFNYAQALLQIAIVLASSSLILGGALLMWTSGVLGVLGSISMVNAFTLFFELPFLA